MVIDEVHPLAHQPHDKADIKTSVNSADAVVI